MSIEAELYKESLNPANWPYFEKKVDLFTVTADGKEYFITPKNAETLKKAIDNPSNNTRLLHLGEDSVRLYMVTKITKKEGKNFSKLPEYVRQNLLKEQDIFTSDELKQFTPKIKEMATYKGLTSGASDGKA